MLVAWVAWMHGHRGIAQHGFRPRGGKANEFATLFHRVAESPEAALGRLMVHFIVGDGGLELRVPVDQPLAPINAPIAEEIEKGVAHRADADRVKREARPGPIAAA